MSDPTFEEMVKKDREGPPRFLVDLRLIYNGQEPKTPAQNRLKELWDKAPGRFLDRLERAEAEYRSASVSDETDDACAPDPVSDRILEQHLAEEWAQVQRALEWTKRDEAGALLIIDPGPGDRDVLVERGLAGSDGRLTEQGRRVLGLPDVRRG